MAATISEWAAWRLEVFGDPYLVWHDGADLTLVLDRWESDPDRVLHMIGLGVAERDPLAAQLVAFLARQGHPLDTIREPLRRSLSTASGTFRVRLAESLFAMTDDAGLAENVCDVLTSASSWTERMDACIALAAFPVSPSVVAALVGGVQDEEYLVRRHSAQTMLVLAGRHTTIEKIPDLWNLIRPERDARSWQAAANRLSAALSD